MSDLARQRRRYRRRRKWVLLYLGGKCVQCGSIERLEVDHIENKPDKIDIGKLWSYHLDAVKRELENCQLLCKVCHTKKSILERGHSLDKHGYTRYKNHGCRCPICVEEYRLKSREYTRLYRERKRNVAP